MAKINGKEFVGPPFTPRFPVDTASPQMFNNRHPALVAACSDSFSGGWVHEQNKKEDSYEKN